MKRNLLKNISTLILIAFCLQLFAGTGYAQALKSLDTNKIVDKLNKKVEPLGINP